MQNVTAADISTNVTFKTCALARIVTRTVKPYVTLADGSSVAQEEREEPEEVVRVEFISGFADYVLRRTTRHSGCGTGCWEAIPLADARAFYRSLRAAGWIEVEAKTSIIGEVDLPAREVIYSWGEGANRVDPIDLPAMKCPVLTSRYYSTETTCALQPFFATFGGWESHRIEFKELARRYV